VEGGRTCDIEVLCVLSRGWRLKRGRWRVTPIDEVKTNVEVTNASCWSTCSAIGRTLVCTTARCLDPQSVPRRDPYGTYDGIRAEVRVRASIKIGVGNATLPSIWPVRDLPERRRSLDARQAVTERAL
jgi:hypothetical protein